MIFVYILLFIAVITLVQAIFEVITDLTVGIFNLIFVEYWYVSIMVLSAWLYWRIKEKRRTDAEEYARNEERIKLRDAEVQDKPYQYEIGKHANQTLAIRYGLANNTVQTEPYFYYAKGGVKKRNKDRDKKKIVDSKTITLRKIKPLQTQNHYLVELTNFKKKKAIAIHVKGEEFIRTFYPLNPTTNEEDKDWWRRNPELERALKDNRSFNLKELATFHVEKTVPVTSRYKIH